MTHITDGLSIPNYKGEKIMELLSNIKTEWTNVSWEIPRFSEDKSYDPSFLKEILEQSKLYGETIKVNKHNLIYPNHRDTLFVFISEPGLQFQTKNVLRKNAYDEILVRDHIVNNLRLEGFSESSLEFMKSIKVNSTVDPSDGTEVLGFMMRAGDIFIQEYDPYYRWAIHSKP